MKQLALNTLVAVSPKDQHPAFEFQGRILQYNLCNDTYLVVDQDEDVFQVDSDQITEIES